MKKSCEQILWAKVANKNGEGKKMWTKVVNKLLTNPIKQSWPYMKQLVLTLKQLNLALYCIVLPGCIAVLYYPSCRPGCIICFAREKQTKEGWKDYRVSGYWLQRHNNRGPSGKSEMRISFSQAFILHTLHTLVEDFASLQQVWGSYIDTRNI